MITGGDRTDVQTAALEASGIECILLTGGFRPPDAVLGLAASAGVPILLAQTDTITTLDMAEAVVTAHRTRDRRAVDRMGRLLNDYADVDAMLIE